MIVQELEFVAPSDVAGVVSALAEHPYGAKLLAGGMSIVPMMNLGLARPEVVVSLSRVEELRFIDATDGLRIGATTTHAELARNDAVRRLAPMLAKAASGIGDVQVRNRGTIGGSLAHGDPAADYLPVLIAHNARCEVTSSRGSRWIPAVDLVVDIMQTSLEADEVIVAVDLPPPSGDAGSSFARLARVKGNYAIVTAAAVATADSVRAVVGGATATPVVAESFTDEAQGADAVEEIVARIEELTEGAYGDIAGDAEYRRAMAREFARRVAEQAVGDRPRSRGSC